MHYKTIVIFNKKVPKNKKKINKSQLEIVIKKIILQHNFGLLKIWFIPDYFQVRIISK